MLEISLKQLEDEFRRVNQRLVRCHELTKRGFYENAVQLAEEQKPTVMDECTRLSALVDSLLSSASPEFIEQLGKSTEAAIDVPYVHSLQEAYEKAEKSKEFQATHRKLVLMRAPAPSRLAVMRDWLATDPTHPFLDSEIRELEKFWFRQVGSYCRKLARRSRTKEIGEVYDDLQQGNYVEPIPPKVIENILAAGRESRLNRIPQLEREIKQHFKDKDFEKLNLSFAELDKIFSDTKTEGKEVEKRLSKCRRWLLDEFGRMKMEKEKSEGKDELSKLIQNRNSLPSQIEVALTRCISLDVVNEVEIHEAKAAIQERVGRKKRIWGIATLCTIVLAVALPLAYMTISNYINSERKILAVLKKVEPPRRQGEFPTARLLIDELDAKLRTDPRVADLQKNLEIEESCFQEIDAKLAILQSPQPQYMSTTDIEEYEKSVEVQLAELEKRRDSQGQMLFTSVRELRDTLYKATTKRNNKTAVFKTDKTAEFNARIADFGKMCGELQSTIAEDPALAKRELESISTNCDAIFREGEQWDIELGLQEAFDDYQAKLDAANQFLVERREIDALIDESTTTGLTPERLDKIIGARDALRTSTVNLSGRVRNCYRFIAGLNATWQEQGKNNLSTRDLASLPNKLSPFVETAASKIFLATHPSQLRSRLQQHLEKGGFKNLWTLRDPEATSQKRMPYFVTDSDTEPPSAGESHPRWGITSEKVRIPEDKRPIKAAQQIYYRLATNALKDETEIEAVRKMYEWLKGGEGSERMELIPRFLAITELVEIASSHTDAMQWVINRQQFTEMTSIRDTYLKVDSTGQKWAIEDWHNEPRVKQTLRTLSPRMESTIQKLPEFTGELAERIKSFDASLGNTNSILRVAGFMTQTRDIKKEMVRSIFPNDSTDESRLYVLDPIDSKKAYSLSEVKKLRPKDRRRFHLMPVVEVPNLPTVDLEK